MALQISSNLSEAFEKIFFLKFIASLKLALIVKILDISLIKYLLISDRFD